MQEAPAVAHDHLLKCKKKSKAIYDQTVAPQSISISI